MHYFVCEYICTRGILWSSKNFFYLCNVQGYSLLHHMLNFNSFLCSSTPVLTDLWANVKQAGKDVHGKKAEGENMSLETELKTVWNSFSLLMYGVTRRGHCQKRYFSNSILKVQTTFLFLSSINRALGQNQIYNQTLILVFRAAFARTEVQKCRLQMSQKAEIARLIMASENLEVCEVSGAYLALPGTRRRGRSPGWASGNPWKVRLDDPAKHKNSVHQARGETNNWSAPVLLPGRQGGSWAVGRKKAAFGCSESWQGPGSRSTNHSPTL